MYFVYFNIYYAKNYKILVYFKLIIILKKNIIKINGNNKFNIII